jgi:DNA-binding MarR family transcriptional regulator
MAFGGPREQMLAWTGLVRSAVYLLQAADEYLRGEFGMSFAEKSLLAQLAMGEGQLPMAELAERLVITRAGMTKMADRLEEAGLVRREPSASDRRVTLVSLTAEGRRLHERIKGKFIPWIEEHFANHLTVDELRSVRTALLKVVEANAGVIPEADLQVD